MRVLRGPNSSPFFDVRFLGCSWGPKADFNRFLVDLNMGRKTIKNVSKILPKLATKTILQFGSILNPTWLHFGMVLGAKLKSKSDQNRIQDVFKFDVYFLFDFVSLPGPILGPSWPDKLIPGPNLVFSRLPMRAQN